MKPGDRVLGHALGRELPGTAELMRWEAGEAELVVLRKHVCMRPGAREGFLAAGREGGGPVRMTSLLTEEWEGAPVRLRAKVRGGLEQAEIDDPAAVAAWLANEVPQDATVDEIVLDADLVPRYFPLGLPRTPSVAAPKTVWSFLGLSRPLEPGPAVSLRLRGAQSLARVLGTPPRPAWLATVPVTPENFGAIAARSGSDPAAVRRAIGRRWVVGQGDELDARRAATAVAELGWAAEVATLDAVPPRFWLPMLLAGAGNLPLLLPGTSLLEGALVAGFAGAGAVGLARALWRTGAWRRAQRAQGAWDAWAAARSEDPIYGWLATSTEALPEIVRKDVAEERERLRNRLARGEDVRRPARALAERVGRGEVPG